VVITAATLPHTAELTILFHVDKIQYFPTAILILVF